MTIETILADVVDFITETNKIEGILRGPTEKEIIEYNRFINISYSVGVTVEDLEQFVSVYQPGARLRIIPGLNVRVGDYVAPSGGPFIKEQLETILYRANNYADIWGVHVAYETLHPFSDGNGRSGRQLWAWMMGGYHPRGFLHEFYYQTLKNSHD